VSRRRDKPLGWRGSAALDGLSIPYLPDLAEALGGRQPDYSAALTFQQIEYYAAETPDGWVAISLAELERDVRYSRMTASRALRKLADRALLDEKNEPGPAGRGVYRPNWRELRRLVPRADLSADAAALEERVAWAEALEEHRTRTRSAQSETPGLSQFETPEPLRERDRGPESPPSAFPLDVDREGDVDVDPDPDPNPASSSHLSSAAAAAEKGEGEGDGFGSGFVPLRLAGDAPTGSVLHALRLLGKLVTPAGATSVFHELDRGEDPDDVAKDYGLRYRYWWAVRKVADYLRSAPGSEHDRLRAFVVQRARECEEKERAKRLAWTGGSR
jgi:hypothetical protein